MLSEARLLVKELCKSAKKGYGDVEFAHCDEVFAELASVYLKCNADQRAVIREMVSAECRLFILGFSDRFAIRAERTDDPDLLFFAVLAHSIEGFSYDERENIVRLSLIEHIAKKLSQSPKELFERAAKLSSEKAAKAFQGFASRPDHLKTLRAMGIVEETTREGVDYRYIYPSE